MTGSVISMHPTALNGFERMLRAARLSAPNAPMRTVLDVGGADINGTVHKLLGPVERIDVLDISSGPGVTIVGDATAPNTWTDIRESFAPLVGYDLIICTEVLEHVRDWPELISGARSVLREGGWFIGTCASTGRREHGARGEHEPPEGEWYENVGPSDLVVGLLACFTGDVVVEYSRDPKMPTTNDLYWRAQA